MKSKGLIILLIAVAFTSCERRDLYVFGDEFHSVTLDVDWRDYDDHDPGGMTVWFYPLDEASTRTDAERYTNVQHTAYRTTTANVRHQELYIPNGRYQTVVVSYSPEEYSRQTFYDMGSVHEARVVATPANYQAKDVRIPGAFVSDSANTAAKLILFGDSAWNSRITQRPEKRDGGYYTIASQPEAMAADTLDNRYIFSGSDFDDYIPYKERDTYQRTITVQQLQSVPHTLVWTLRIRVFVKDGFDYLWRTQASLTGLSDGHFLARHVNTDQACLINLDEWKHERTGDNQGWLSCSLTCFGVRPSAVSEDRVLHPSGVEGKSLYDGTECDLGAYFTGICDSEDLRLNLVFVLRDQETVLSRSFNVGNAATSFDDQLVLRVDVGEQFYEDEGIEDIVLPYVEAHEGAGFDADVTPWEDVEPADVTM